MRPCSPMRRDPFYSANALLRIALVTGGTDGVGMAVARGLAEAGYRVVIVGRDGAKGAASERALREASGNPSVRFVRADLSLMREAVGLASEIRRREPALHLLVHCAGIVRGRHELTDEGIESNFAVNYLARFALTSHLLPSLLAAGTQGSLARILIVGGAARDGTIHFRDPNLTAGFGTIRAVRQFCKANDVFTIELARRLSAGGAEQQATVTSLKLGVVKTNIRRNFPMWMKIVVPLVMDPLLGMTPAEAAAPALRLLLDREYEGESGALFLRIRRFIPIEPSPGTRNPDVGRCLWQLSERMIGAALARHREASAPAPLVANDPSPGDADPDGIE